MKKFLLLAVTIFAMVGFTMAQTHPPKHHRGHHKMHHRHTRHHH